MRRIFIVLLTISFLASCFKMPKDTYISPLNVPADFNWKTLEAKKITLKQTSSVLNDEGDTIASFLPAGDYRLTVDKTTNLTIVISGIAETKSESDNVKEKVYFPAKGKYATVMFEDLFPSKGDMDMNDIVFGLNITFFLDNHSDVIAIQINIQPRAVGSSYAVIGLAANISSLSVLDIVDKISNSEEPALSPLFSVHYDDETYSPELNNSNSQVIPLTGNFRSYFDNDKDLFLNVRNIDRVTPTHDFSVLIEFISSKRFPFSNLTFLDSTKVGMINLDIFAVFGTRGREVHFKGQRPTDKFSFQHFINTYPKTDFSTIDNWVWVLLSYKSIRHQQEFVKIYHAYPNFQAWAEGGGSIITNWFVPSVIDSLYTKADFHYDN